MLNSWIITALRINKFPYENLKTGPIPSDSLKSLFVTLPKNNKLWIKCEEFWLISLMSHIPKCFLKVVHSHLVVSVNAEWCRNKLDFHNVFGILEALFYARTLVQLYDFWKNICICFINLKKTFHWMIKVCWSRSCKRSKQLHFKPSPEFIFPSVSYN